MNPFSRRVKLPKVIRPQVAKVGQDPRSACCKSCCFFCPATAGRGSRGQAREGPSHPQLSGPAATLLFILKAKGEEAETVITSSLSCPQHAFPAPFP